MLKLGPWMEPAGETSANEHFLLIYFPPPKLYHTLSTIFQ